MTKPTTTKDAPPRAPEQPSTLTPSSLVRKRLTPQEAYERDGPAPQGMVWDEPSQEYVQYAAAVLTSRLEEPLDLKRNLEAWKAAREVLKEFVRDYLEEAEYDSKGYLIAGKTNDYYSFPGAPKDGPKALTKRGAEKLAQLYRHAKGGTKTVASTETKEYSSATVEVVLIDQYRREVGSGVASCTTAETGFQQIGAGKKYGGWWDNKDKKWTRVPDFRAALNDIMARATKRAYVQAVIYATGADEFFTVGKEDEPAAAPAKGEDAEVVPQAPPVARLPDRKFGQYAGKPITQVPSDDLAKIHQWMVKEAKNPKAWEPLADAIALELDTRAQDGNGEDDLPL